MAKDDAMQEPRAQRTLVKSPPELWAELSDIDSLARHLGEFGEIRITRLDPETTVAWEGDRACGTVALEPTGWGTKVTITAKLAEEVVAAEPVAAVEPESPAAEPEPEPVAVEPEPEPGAVEAEAIATEPEAPPTEAPKEGFFARMFGRRRKVEPVVEVKAEAEPEPVAVEPEPVAVEPVAVEPEPVAVAAEPVAVEPEPVAVEPEPEPEPQPAVLDVERAEAILTGVLDDLGSAHHRPFSRT
jgi:hypothetical protein